MLTVQALLFIVAIALMFADGVGVRARQVSLATVAWAFAIAAFATPVIAAVF